MKFTLKSSDLFSHLVLNDTDYCMAVAETEMWKTDESLEITILINGVECPAEALDKLLLNMWEQANVETGREAFNLKVKQAAKKIVDEKAGDVLDILNDLQNKLSDMDNLLPYNWEN